MKKIIFISLLMSVSVVNFCQTIPNNEHSIKEDYLKKRSQNNTTAHFMLWGGLATSIIGSTIDQKVNFDGPRWFYGLRTRGDHEYKHAGAAIAYTGLVLMAGSIPFFFFAAKNKKMATSISFNNEPALLIENGDLSMHSIPSLTFKIRL